MTIHMIKQKKKTHKENIDRKIKEMADYLQTVNDASNRAGY